MAENTEQPDDATDEVEAHAILDLQALGKDIDKSNWMWLCLSNLSEANNN